MNMKKFLLLLAFLPLALGAKDLIALQTGQIFEGQLLKLQPRHVVFEVQGQRYRIPLKDVSHLGYDEDAPALDDVDACLRAYNDARLRGREWHNFFGGVFFGPVTVVYDLLKTYHPMRDQRVMLLSTNKGLFSDPVYLECYSYRAKTHAALQAAGGWATWLILLRDK